MTLLDRIVPARLVRTLTRYAVPLAIAAAVLLVGGGAAVAALVSPGALPGGGGDTKVSETAPFPETVRAALLSKADQDKDGLADALENYYYGTDPDNWNSSGLGIPDGWLERYGYDPLNPALVDARGAAPPRSALPDTYDNEWPEKFRLPLRAYYAYGTPDDYAPGESDPWWKKPDAKTVDPTKWDVSGSGIPTGWLLYYGLDPFDPHIGDRPAEGGDSPLTVNESYRYGTNPLAEDSDGDGLTDIEEIETYGTHPGRFSTTGLGVADGWLVHHGINPLDPAAVGEDPDLDGLSNAEEFLVSYDEYRDQVQADGIQILYARGLDPRNWETSGSGIPDGWYVTYGLDPFDADVADRVLQRASSYPDARHLPGDEDLPEGAEAIPDLEMTIRDAYTYNRPTDWDEAMKGVWWGGTNPNTPDGDSDGDGLPDAVEIRGWYVEVAFGVLAEAANRQPVLVSGNPMKADSDDDGLNDLEEYRGRTACGVDGGEERTFRPTNPQNKDTAFSGLTDHEKVCGVVRGPFTYDFHGKTAADGSPLDPTRADSAGDGLKDGVKVDYWHARYARYLNDPTYEFEDSRYGTVLEWTRDYGRFNGLNEAQTLAQFRPDGDADGDGVVNALDAYPAGMLTVERFHPGKDERSVALRQADGIAPSGGEYPRNPTDPANPDTDGDGLPDYWELKFGEWDGEIGRYNPDPAAYDTNADGTPDGDEDPDDDRVEMWFKVVDGQSQQQPPWKYTNALEFKYGTNPRAKSTANDSVPDGWKAFWGGEYPILVQTGQAGDVVPDRNTLQTFGLTANTDLAGWENRVKRHVYARFLIVDGANEDAVRGHIESLDPAAGGLKPSGAHQWEVFGKDAMEGLRAELASLDPDLAASADRVLGRAVEPDAGPEGEDVARIVGVVNLSFYREYMLGTNPYLSDTDGDGMPDAYEVHYRDLDPSGGPSPTVPDGLVNLDNDPLPNVEECHGVAIPRGGDPRFCSEGSSPLLADTDLDGLPDDVDQERLTPNQKDANTDTDGDGLPDLDELQGWGSQLYDTPRRTSSTAPDTDGDGTLDASNRAAGELGSPDVRAQWQRYGYAWVGTDPATGTFLGERAKTDPCTPDTAGDGIPDGWIVYMTDAGAYTGDVRNRAGAFLDDYTHLRPDWWLEPTPREGRCGGTANHGVWWWGRTPTQPGDAEDPDLDRDGLHDINGEDPFPAHGLNRYAYGDTVLTNPDDVEAFVNAAPTPEERLARAQALGEWAGNPLGGRANASTRDADGNRVPERWDRAATRVTGVALSDGADALQNGGYAIEKSRAFTVTGRVEIAEDVPQDGPVDLGNLTVLVSVLRPSADTVIGAGFTNPDGTFTLTANLTREHLVDLVPEGAVLFGKTEGPVTWRIDPGVVRTGAKTNGVPNTLVVWTYNTTSALSNHEARALLKDDTGTLNEVTTHALAGAVAEPVPLTVESTTSFSFDLPEPQVLGGVLRGNVTLADASGAPLGRKLVNLEWSDGRNVVRVETDTNQDGVVDLQVLNVPLDLAAPGSGLLTATFQSTAEEPSLMGTSGSASVRLVLPSAFTLSVDRSSTNVGDDITFTGTLRTLPVNGHPGGPLGGEDVQIELGSLTAKATTGADGTYHLRLRVPGSLPPGEATATATYAGSDDANGATASVPLEIRRTSEIQGLEPVIAPASGSIILSGHLVDNAGAPIFGDVTLRVAGRTLSSSGTGEGGVFILRGSLEGVPLGLHEARVSFAGDDRYAATSNATTVKVVSPARIEVTRVTDPVLRGQYLGVEGRLLDTLGRPIEGAPVEVTFRGEAFGVAITDANGRFTHSALVNETARLGDAAIGLRYTPPETSVYRTATAETVTIVQSGAQLSWEDREIRRGGETLRGRLVDDRGLALPAQPIHLTWEGGDAVARTTRNGSFAFPLVVPQKFDVGPYVATARFDGTERYAADEAEATLTLRSDVRIHLGGLGTIIRGEPLNLHGEALQDNGDGVTGTLQATLGGVKLGEVTVRNGVFNTTLDVPLEVPRDEQELLLTYAGDRYLDDAELRMPVLVKIRPQVKVDVPTVALRGFAFDGVVTVHDDQGEPLRNAPFVYTVGDGRQTFLGRTDDQGQARIGGVGSGDATYLTLAVQAGPGVLPSEVRTESIRVVNPAIGTGAGLLALALATALVVAIVLGVYLWRRRRQIEEVREILQDAIEGISAGNEYAATIFLAYRRLAAHLGQYGFVEQESDTAREFVLGVRRAVPVSGDGLRRLIRLFEKARYSEERILATDRDEALKSLVGVRNELDAILGQPEGETA